MGSSMWPRLEPPLACRGQQRQVYRQAAVPPILPQGWRWQDEPGPGPLRGPGRGETQAQPSLRHCQPFWLRLSPRRTNYPGNLGQRKDPSTASRPAFPSPLWSSSCLPLLTSLAGVQGRACGSPAPTAAPSILHLLLYVVPAGGFLCLGVGVGVCGKRHITKIDHFSHPEV